MVEYDKRIGMRQRENEGEILCFPVSYRSKQGKNISFLPIASIKSGNHFRGMLPLRPFEKHILAI